MYIPFKNGGKQESDFFKKLETLEICHKISRSRPQKVVNLKPKCIMQNMSFLILSVVSPRLWERKKMTLF